MSLSECRRSEILRLYLAEHWRVGTIARQLGIHHSTVERVISQAGMPKIERSVRPSIIDPYLPMITETLAQHPTLSATRLYQMAVARGYGGGLSHFRQRIAQMRPRPLPEAYLRLRTLPGEQAQVDWGHFGHLQIGRARRPLMAFVMVLSHSRRVFLRYFLNAQMSAFLLGHVEAFAAFGGVPRVLLYDNLKSAVLARHGQLIEFNPQLTALSCHYRFEPRPVGVRRGNEKGRVERAIRYIRDSFFAARHFTNLADLNEQARDWCEGVASERACPDEPDRTVDEAFADERSHLMALPDSLFDTAQQTTVKIAKTPWARFDLNDYSVPHQHVRKALTVRASETRVRLLDADEVVAEHDRSWDKGARIEDPGHSRALKAHKRASREHAGGDRLIAACPQVQQLLGRVLDRGQSLPGAIRALEALLDTYGPSEFAMAIDEVLASDSAHAGAVEQALERRRAQRGAPPPMSPRLPEAARRVHSPAPARLADYDRINPLPDTDTGVTEEATQ